mmetsp:Transcript_40769/g.120874  ORF Transcript_40769/g.120874 Transcript_40769/m.120874 type:complete len:200 (-) Transcript_40769:27-626(-)
MWIRSSFRQRLRTSRKGPPGSIAAGTGRPLRFSLTLVSSDSTRRALSPESPATALTSSSLAPRKTSSSRRPRCPASCATTPGMPSSSRQRREQEAGSTAAAVRRPDPQLSRCSLSSRCIVSAAATPPSVTRELQSRRDRSLPRGIRPTAARRSRSVVLVFCPRVATAAAFAPSLRRRASCWTKGHSAMSRHVQAPPAAS